MAGKGDRPRAKRPSQLLPAVEYDRLLTKQNGVCAICGAKPKTRKLAIDHDHSVKGELRVRGLLCHRCNRALPSWVTPKWLAQAHRYLHPMQEGIHRL